MVDIKRNKPIAQFIEERKTLHLRETSEIDVRTLLLHIQHAIETLFNLFQFTLLLSGMQNILHRILLHLFYPITCHTECLTIHQVRHNLLLYGLGILFGIETEDYLLLQFC